MLYAAAAKLLQLCPTLCDPIDGSPTRLHHPWDSPGKNTGVGCHFLLQCLKVKSESEVAQSFPTLSDPMDCSPPGSSVHGIFQARVLEWVAIAFSNLLYICTLKYMYLSLDAQLVFFLELLVLFSITIFRWSRGRDGDGNGNPLQYSCLENPMDGGAW